MSLNRLSEFAKIAQKIESDTDYYKWGRPQSIGILENLLAYFGVEFECQKPAPVMHRENLSRLERFITNEATAEQIKWAKAYVNGEIPPEQLNRDDLEHSGDVFISMPMNEEKCADVKTIRQGIKRAVEECGKTPFFLDNAVHNENIVQKMIEEIRGCLFLVADFTSQNTGVYYEAGYAKALGKTVIHTCKASDFDNVHFDIRQTQFVKWTSEDDLASGLAAQIRKSMFRKCSNQ